MAKIKLTTQELKRQRSDLKRYRRFLPTLVLKKLQIQIELNKVKRALSKREEEEKELIEELGSWVALLGEEVGLPDMVEVESLHIEKGNVAGVEIPIFKGIRFKSPDYDLYASPLWVDNAVEAVTRIVTLRAERTTMTEQIDLLEKELRTTIQRVNLFEKVKIPQTQENIRAIQIFLGDQHTAAVVRGKMAKIKGSQPGRDSSPDGAGMA
jgi:V/A-type H+-transporting ATPase subunit D